MAEDKDKPEDRYHELYPPVRLTDSPTMQRALVDAFGEDD